MRVYANYQLVLKNGEQTVKTADVFATGDNIESMARAILEREGTKSVEVWRVDGAVKAMCFSLDKNYKKL